MKPQTLETQRLRLRPWRPSDYVAYAKLNADPEVMRYFVAPMSRTESDAQLDLMQSRIDANGWGFWAAETLTDHTWLGFVGLNPLHEQYPFGPGIEIGWRLAKEFWGQGFATEAANECLRFAFEILHQNETFSFTAVPNKRSRAVMERIGMTNTEQNFRHFQIPETHPLSEHVLYCIRRNEWQALLSQSS